MRRRSIFGAALALVLAAATAVVVWAWLDVERQRESASRRRAARGAGVADRDLRPADYIRNEGDAAIARRIVPWGPRDYFRLLDHPPYVSAAEAAAWMSDDEVVLGVALNGDVRAYPINYLNDHEMVEDEIGGLPVLVTW